MKKLKLVTPTLPETENTPYIINDDQGEFSSLAYKDTENNVQILKEGCELLTCEGFKTILKDLIKGTKFIASIYNPVLYSLTPGIEENDSFFNIENDFIPNISVQDLIRDEVDGFLLDPEVVITQDSVRSIKACDSWNNSAQVEVLEESINARIKELFGYYEDYPEIDFSKEVSNSGSGFSVDLSENSIVVSLTSETTYTDTINLEDWVYNSGQCNQGGMYYNISGKLDISYMYSKGSRVYSGMQTIKAFQYEGNLVSKNIIIELGDIQIEYLDYVLKIYPISSEVNEAIINDCTLTIGVL